MTLPDLLDLAYTLAVERVEKHVLAVIAAGGDVQLLEALAALDADLNAPLVRLDISPEQAELRRVLGVA